jgi:hypothetical protein
MFSKHSEVTPQTSLFASNADFEALAGFTFNASDAPVIAFAMAIWKKILSKLLNTLA